LNQEKVATLIDFIPIYSFTFYWKRPEMTWTTGIEKKLSDLFSN